jgi:trans-aconitate methyltransferase
MSADDAPRSQAYGERRRFRGLERYAIGLRLRVAAEALERLQAELGRDDLSVLELGCGYNADNLTYLRERHPRARFVGVDLRVNPEVSRDGIELVSGDMDRWQPSGTFDFVLSLALAEHLVDLPRHFRLISSSLAPHGIAFLTTPQPQAHAVLWLLSALGIFDKDEIADHKLYPTRAGLRALAEGAALELCAYRSFSLWMNQWASFRKKADAGGAAGSRAGK